MRFISAVERINEIGEMVGVTGKKETTIFSVGNSTKITEAGKEMPCAGLKKDVEVSVDDMDEGD